MVMNLTGLIYVRVFVKQVCVWAVILFMYVWVMVMCLFFESSFDGWKIYSVHKFVSVHVYIINIFVLFF